MGQPLTKLAGALAAVVALGVWASARPDAQGLSFRSTSDLIAVDVQVVGNDGTPVPSLTKDDFRVNIAKRPRNVLNATYLTYDTRTRAQIAEAAGPAAVADAGPAPAPDSTEGRTFIVAIDLLTFDVHASRSVAKAARDFIEKLGPHDKVGLYPYPLGRRVEPTTDRAPVYRGLDNLAGQRVSSMSRRFYLSSADIVDWWATAGESSRIIARECGTAEPVGGFIPGGGRGNANCISELTTEVGARTQEFESAGMLSIGMLRDLFEDLGKTSGRKHVVLVSGGMPLSDRPGGRPNGGTSGQDLGVLAARANVGLYSLYMDQTFFERVSAANRTPNHQPVNLERESLVLGQWLSMLSTGAGGALVRIIAGNGELSYNRVIRETSSYYLLGVEPTAADRGGKPQAIEVSVNKPGLTVRSRRWVLMPQG